MNRLTRTSCALLALCSLAATTHAASVQSDFDAANRAYGAGNYAEAARAYQSILQANGYSACVLFNLANAYYRQAKTGAAILSYERALRLAPRDPDIEANLKYARAQSGLHQPSPQWWRALLQGLTPSQWSWAASGTLYTLSLLWLVSMFRPDCIQRLGVSGGLQTPVWRLFLSLNAMTLILLVTCSALSMRDNRGAVITAKEAPLLISPFDNMESIATLSEGELVEVEKKYGDYALVRYEKAKSGWVFQSQLGTIDPDLLKTLP